MLIYVDDDITNLNLIHIQAPYSNINTNIN